MRQIKFRGKRVDKGEWVYGYYAVEDGKHGILTDPGDKNPRLLWVEVVPETVGQYTGLKDLNGVEIYEGDIVTDAVGRKWAVGYSNRMSSLVFKYVFKYAKNGRKSQMFSRFNSDQEPLEITGNIHDKEASNEDN